MKTYKIKGQLVVDCEWLVQVEDNQNLDDAWDKVVEDGCFLDAPMDDDITRIFTDVDRYDESSIYVVCTDSDGKEHEEYLFDYKEDIDE